MHKRSKAEIRAIKSKSDFRGKVQFLDTKNNNFCKVHRTDCKLIKLPNGKMAIQAKSPNGTHNVHRIMF